MNNRGIWDILKGIKGLFLIFILHSLCATTVKADCVADKKNFPNLSAAQSALWDKQCVESMMKALDASIAVTDVNISTSKLTAETNIRNAAQAKLDSARLLQQAQNIEALKVAMSVKSAELILAADPSRSCDAVNFVIYQCEGKTLCTFVVDKSICHIPGNEEDPMLLRVLLSCDGSEKISDIRFKDTAWLSCAIKSATGP